MARKRLKYLGLVIVIIFLGLLSCELKYIPLSVGDALWAIMIFFIMRMIFIHFSIQRISLLSLSFCYAIEFSQLYQAEWLNNIRKTLLGRLVLGQGFLWSDLAAYAVGIGFVLFIYKVQSLWNKFFQ